MIYLIFGHPGQGKSYTATHFGVQAMRKGRQVYSNFPIIDGKRRSMVWKKEYSSLPNPPIKCDVIIDEAYRDYNSRRFAEFTVEDHTYFATNRHNEVNLFICVQNPARIDKVIREISQFILVKKRTFLWRILGFRLEYYEFEDDLAGGRGKRKEGFYRKEFIWFKKDVARSYDTHYYGKHDQKPFEGEVWTLPGEIIDSNERPGTPGHNRNARRSLFSKFKVPFMGGKHISDGNPGADNGNRNHIRSSGDIRVSERKGGSETRGRIRKIRKYDLWESRGMVREIKSFFRFYYRMIFGGKRIESKY